MTDCRGQTEKDRATDVPRFPPVDQDETATRPRRSECAPPIVRFPCSLLFSSSRKGRCAVDLENRIDAIGDVKCGQSGGSFYSSNERAPGDEQLIPLLVVSSSGPLSMELLHFLRNPAIR